MFATLLLSLAFTLQTPSNAEKAAPAATVDAKLHADAVELVEVSGSRKKLQENLPKIAADGRKKMLEECPACKPEFAEEWAKRMVARLNVDDFVAVSVEEYEKYLTDDEILELIKLQRAAKEGHPAVPSDALKARLTAVMPALIGDVVGRCAQIGAKLGAEVASEVAKDHPDWTAPPVAAPSKP